MPIADPIFCENPKFKFGFSQKMLVSIYRLQKEFFKCFSKSRVFRGLLKAMAVLIRRDLNFDVWGFLQLFASLPFFEAKAGRGERI